MPALSSALAYFDSYRQGRGTSNLIQAQRDFFGAHGFERIDGEGAFHGPWGSGTADVPDRRQPESIRLCRLRLQLPVALGPA